MRGAGLVGTLLAIGMNEEPPPGMLSKPPSRDAEMKLERRYKLTRPPGKRLPDSFFADVAHAYQSAIAFGKNPRQAIVEDTGAADATVAGWIVAARRLGHLPETSAGRVTA
jgi:hypothetical protein